MKVYIWGTGIIASEYLEEQEVGEDDILGFIESKRTKYFFRGKKVYEPHEIAARNDYDYILVCLNYYGRAIYNICTELKIDTDKLVFLDNWEWIDGSTMDKVPMKCCREIKECNVNVEKIFPKLNAHIKEHNVQGKYAVVAKSIRDFSEKESPMLSDGFSGREYQLDYFRFRTFELVANQIISQKVIGNVAELGVFRGTFSKLINAKFPDRKLYLFDTFESFEPNEFQKEQEAGHCSPQFFGIFENTSVDGVLAIMKYPEMCVIKKGLFPDSAVGLENEQYAFVSIDVDFEKSTLEGLRYFYPRLNKGGIMFLHDFNHNSLEGVRNAVDAYQSELGSLLSKVPIADEAGTLIIVK